MVAEMKYCKGCNINIIDKCTQCPLCGGAVKGVQNDDTEISAYPNPIPTQAVKELVVKIIFATTTLITIFSVVLNILYTSWFNFTFWPIVVLCFFYGWLVTKPLWMQTRNFASIILGAEFLTIFFIFCLDYLLGWVGWSLHLAFPIVCIASVIASILVYILKKSKRSHYALFEVLSSVIAFIPIVLTLTSVTNTRILSLISAVCGFSCILLVWIIGGSETKSELSRRLKF